MHSTFIIIFMLFLGCYPEREPQPEPTPENDKPNPTLTEDAGRPAPIDDFDAGQPVPPVADGGQPAPTANDAGPSTTIEADAGPLNEPETNDAGSPPSTDQDAGQPDPCGQHQLEEVFEWPFSWPMPTAEISIPANEAFKTTITPDDNLLADSEQGVSNPMQWVKFAILVSDPTKVYFQNSNTYPFHYDFAKEHLTPFIGMSPQEFDNVSLYKQGQEVILGAVIFQGSEDETFVPDEYGVQLIRQDPYHPEMVQTVFELVKSAIVVDSHVTPFYFPSYEDSNWQNANTLCALEHFYIERGIPLSNITRWLEGNACYNEGWTHGVLRYVESESIEDAYQNGDLLPTDILVTDGIPAELPFVTGIITLAPTTPNSHVAILAQVYQIPFIYAHESKTIADAMALLEQEVVFTAIEETWFTDYNPCYARFFQIEDAFDPDTEAALFALKAPQAVAYTPMAAASSYSIDLDNFDGDFIQPENINLVGGKAANFGILREALPNNSPQAIAFTFDLWNDFMTQTVEGGDTINTVIGNKLSEHTYPPNTEALFSDLDEIRDLIKDGAFTTTQQESVMAALSEFDEDKKIRFRSSTNLEDTLNFTGAGLYSSYSGCQADDNDADDEGPSHCDPSKEKERGVFRAIKKVFASFYNDNAYMERLRRGVNEEEVGMAVLAHYSFPDEFELANGVATLFKDEYGRYTVDLVSQPNAVSVTNPETAALPEVVQITMFEGGDNPNNVTPGTLQYAELLPLGANVLDTSDDATLNEYITLGTFLYHAAAGFEAATGITTNYLLDFEYKKVEDWGLVVKQIRQIPVNTPENDGPLFLLDEDVTLCVYQGEYGSVYDIHRGKLNWDLTTSNMQIPSPADFHDSFIEDTSLSIYSESSPANMSGSPTQWNEGVFSFCGNGIQEGDEACDEGLSPQSPCSEDQKGCFRCTGSCQVMLDDKIACYEPCSTTQCTADITTNCCGNGIVEGHEKCDDQDDENCTWYCEIAVVLCDEDLGLTTNCCGDGVLQPETEECDDGNNYNGDKCRQNCTYPTLNAPRKSTHSWQMDHGTHETKYQVNMELVGSHPPAVSPLLSMNDVYIVMGMEHSVPQTILNGEGLGTTRYQTVRLEACRGEVLPENSLYIERTFDGFGHTDYAVVAKFYHQPEPEGPTAGYTAPMEKWINTTIEGLTTEPLVLSSTFSQSYRPGHHNFWEDYLFEPRLDPNVSPAQLAELDAMNILRIFWVWSKNHAFSGVHQCTDDLTSNCCGNGVIEGDEECDNGDNSNGSGCDWNCTMEVTACEEDGPSTNCCGDGVIQGHEECDDGNNEDADGCSRDCDVVGILGYETTDGNFIILHQ